MNDKRTFDIDLKQTELNSEKDQILVSKNDYIQNKDPASLIIKIKNFMDGALKFKSNQDLSFNWILEDENIKFICEPITSNLENLKTNINSRDLLCELKVNINFFTSLKYSPL
jgi:hypothetical protein